MFTYFFSLFAELQYNSGKYGVIKLIIQAKKCYIYFIIFIPLVIALIFILFQNNVWSNVLLPINSFIAMGVLFFAYNKSKNRNLLLFSIASLAWGIGELLWAFLETCKIKPSENILASSIYFITNFLLFLTFIVYSYNHSNKWNIVQMYLDALIIGLLNLTLIWMVFFEKDSNIIQIMLESGIISVLSIVFDVLLSVAVISWLFSIRSGNIALHDKVIFSGILLFSFDDILFYYADFHNIYLSNSLIDFTYILSLQIIAFGVLLKTNSKESSVKCTYVTNVGNTNSWLYLFIFPIGSFIFEISDIIEVTVTPMDILILIVMIFLYRAASKYVQLSIQNERLLAKEKHMNELLEKRVAEQVTELSYLANRDPLTTLFNRRYFYSSIDQSIQSISPNETLALVLIDVDRFKKINDGFGHDAGDKVLIELSNRIIEWNRIGAILCRLGGDEFAIMMIGIYTRKNIQEYCNELIHCCYEPISIGDSVINMSVSVGIALYSEESNNRKTIMKHADIAMYRAKSQGYNKCQFYNALFSKNFDRKSKIELLLKNINVEKDFELYYQPQFSLLDMTLIGAEALIRWNHPRYGYIPPALFIPIAEEVNRINVIGKWVIRESLKQAMVWNQSYPNNIKIGFNVSVRQFVDDEFISFLKSSLVELNINSAWLDAELTESVMITDGNKVSKILKQMNQLGLTISIDDFGVGYSSLAYLNKYHFDRIKIDKSLVDQVSSDNASGINVVKAVISMAKAVGIKTIAEGVETQEQLDILSSLGCDEVQGYLLGKPVPSNIFEQNFLIMNDAAFQMSLQSLQYNKN